MKVNVRITIQANLGARERLDVSDLLWFGILKNQMALRCGPS